jgi:hypothetical protein
MPHRIPRKYRAWSSHLDEGQRGTLRTAWVVLPFFVLGMGAIALLMLSLTKPLRVEAPFVFTRAVFAPTNGTDFCPGDLIEWPVAFEVRRAPVMVISVRSIWDVDNNQTATLPAGEFVAGALQFTNYTETTAVSRTATMALPTLPPGRYQIRSAAQEFNSQAAAYATPFSIREGC